jgi:hypothetical protein
MSTGLSVKPGVVGPVPITERDQAWASTERHKACESEELKAAGLCMERDEPDPIREQHKVRESKDLDMNRLCK